MSGNSVAFLHEEVFFIYMKKFSSSILFFGPTTGRLWRVSEKKLNEAEEIASLNMGAFPLVFIANVRDFYTVAFGCGES